MTDVRTALRETERVLAAAGVPSPRVDGQHLLCAALGLSRTALFVDPERSLDAAERTRLQRLVERRASREPLAYVLGEWGFRRLTLKVDRRALVPRPETEVVVGRCLELLRELPEPLVLDLGTGSGAIALALVDEHAGVRALAVDADAAALALARENAAATGLGARVGFLQADLAHLELPERFDLVVSNPPYVNPTEIESLEPEVRLWEPRRALEGTGFPGLVGESGRRLLRPGGHVVLEVGDGQAEDAAATLRALGFAAATITLDLTGQGRVVEARWET